jgi:hypothetical protein
MSVGVSSLRIFSLSLGASLIGCNVQITENAPPLNGASSIGFTDTDSIGGKLAGDVAIGKAADESDVSYYVLYWASNVATKLSDSAAPIVILPRTGSNLLSPLIAGTAKPARATHLLVFTKNKFGEAENGVSVRIVDKGGEDKPPVPSPIPEPLPPQPLIASPASCKAIDYDGDGKLRFEEIRIAEDLVRKSCTTDAPLEVSKIKIADRSTTGSCSFLVGRSAFSAPKGTLGECVEDLSADTYPSNCSSFPGENYSYRFLPYSGTGTTLDPYKKVLLDYIVLKSGRCPGERVCFTYDKVKQFDLDGNGVMTEADISGFSKFVQSCQFIMR